ncbi:hypothetical protein [Arcanobacterium buesumense]|uniref:Uncharacterized protein n=1 Tax=Arcanobacterium buesumense TaxID=2722751 RepID=A0A6H2ELR1_9ACTO|nr:hypothetical protein [Arcanobacterium buesumense]QJC22018.1 hypothetical protein HC352_05555 [Arcanobacterium buesumense]
MHATITPTQCAELDIMHQELNDALQPSLHAIQYHLAPACRSARDHHQPDLDAINADHAHITNIAQEHGYATATALAPHLNQLNTENLTYLTETYIEWAQLLKLTPQPTQHLCPMCTQTNLLYRDTDTRYICPACEGAWTPPQLRNAQKIVIATAGKWITRKQARNTYTITAPHLRKLIHRGIITPNHDGLIYEPQLAKHLQ